MCSAVFLLLVSAILWSVGGLLIKLINLNPMAIAGIYYALTVILFVVSTKITTAANAIVLQYTAPFLCLILCRPRQIGAG